MQISLYPKQTAVLLTEAQEILYGGAAGSAKSFCVRALALIHAIEVPGIQIAIFRRTYKEALSTFVYTSGGLLEMGKDLIDQKLMKFNKSDSTFEFVNGSRITLNHCQHATDRYNFQGQEIHLLLMDEATLFEKEVIQFLRSRVRLGSFKVPESYQKRLPKIVYTANPGGLSHAYFKKNFVSVGENRIWRAPPDEGGMLRTFIPSRLTDNPVMMKNDPLYADRLRGLGNPTLVEAMLNGSWDITGSNALVDWDSKIHVIEPFKIPNSWKIKRSFDWGSAAPYAVVYLAVSNGEDYQDAKGRWRSAPKGSVFVIDEIYGADGEGKGLRQSPDQIAARVLSKDHLWADKGYIITPGAADSSIYNNDRGESIGTLMEKSGISWVPANKSPGSRIQGLQILNQMVYEATKIAPEKPILKVFDTCPTACSQLADLPLDPKNPEDVDSSSDDHLYDALRYGLLEVSNSISKSVVVGL
jgi:hypothetical protein